MFFGRGRKDEQRTPAKLSRFMGSGYAADS